MYYVWTVSGNYPKKYWLKYNWDKNPDYLQFLDNKRIDTKGSTVEFELDKTANRETFLKYDYVMSDAVNLISERLARILEQSAKGDIQLIKATVRQSGDIVADYYIPVILNVISCVDNKKSHFDKDVEDYTKLYFKENSLKKHTVVRAKEHDLGILVVTENFAKECEKAKIKGAEFFREPYINPLYEWQNTKRQTLWFSPVDGDIGNKIRYK